MTDEKKVLFLCDASDFDVVTESFANYPEYHLTVETFEKILRFGVKEYLDETIERINNNPEMYDGIVGTHDSSAIIAAIVAQETGKRFASVDAVINCQNKYLCRRIQKQVVPEHAPNYAIALDYLRNPDRLQAPFFIKPARSNISFGTHKVEHPPALENYITRESIDIARYNQYYLDALSHRPSYQHAMNIATCNSFLCEDFIEGTQVTVDGYIFDGEINFFGVTKAYYYPETNSFFYHAFPHQFSAELEEKIQNALVRLIPAVGIDNSFFNVELRADEANNTFKIIEINSRIAFQFAKTIEAVRGFDPLHLLCDVAVGKKPDMFPVNENRFKYCYNFELHHFSDARILQTPTQSAYEEIRLKYPEVYIRNLIHESLNLSDFKHNPDSFRYGVVDVPGNNHEEIMEKYEDVVSMLGYKFAAIDSTMIDPAIWDFPGTPPRHSQGEGNELAAQPPLDE
ncbi:MAG TPA: ATP-grasp domain-containing protein [Desulfosalsimonadaceae bacterium]|nr:ATP-grasp domain-containing protein [Desulfosalsimonadaceae bacterium]